MWDSAETEKVMKRKYASKKASTVGRTDKLGVPIEMKLSFEEYFNLYKEAGVIPSTTYVLARKNDLGHYEAGNVEVQYFLDNIMSGQGRTSTDDLLINSLVRKTGYKRMQVRKMLKSGQMDQEGNVKEPW